MSRHGACLFGAWCGGCGCPFGWGTGSSAPDVLSATKEFAELWADRGVSQPPAPRPRPGGEHADSVAAAGAGTVAPCHSPRQCVQAPPALLAHETAAHEPSWASLPPRQLHPMPFASVSGARFLALPRPLPPESSAPVAVASGSRGVVPPEASRRALRRLRAPGVSSSLSWKLNSSSEPSARHCGY